MSKSFDKEIEDMASKIEEQLKPLMDLSNITNSIEKLKDLIPKEKPNVDLKDEGETCMHNNSWHSNCSDCDELNTIDGLCTLVEDTRNDKELGKKIRQIYWAYKNSDADSVDEPSDKQLNLFDDPVTKDRKRWGG